MAETKINWLKSSTWGVSFNYDPHAYENGAVLDAAAWNQRINAFDVEGLVQQLEEVGAAYLMLTLGWNSGNYLAPNPVYDQYTGIRPSRCSERDLISELGNQLKEKGIRLMVFIPSHPPLNDEEACLRLRWESPSRELSYFERKAKRTERQLYESNRVWEEVLKSWSERFGDAVSAWWIDGCQSYEALNRHEYVDWNGWCQKKDMYMEHPGEYPLLAKALQAGNPDALLGFNRKMYAPVAEFNEFEDFVAGEVRETFPLMGLTEDWSTEFDIRKQVLLFLGEPWNESPLDAPRFPDDLVQGYIEYLNGHDTSVTWDVPVQSNGLIKPAFLGQLKGISRHDS